MVCDFCHEDKAVIFLEQVNNGQKRKINMCMKCALERGISDDPRSIEASIGDLFSELTAVAQKLRAEDSRMCPVCGTSLSQIKKSMMTGCPDCYSIFKADIRKLLESKGISGTYSGSMPQRLSSVHSVLNDRMILQNKLDAAVASEDYEKAALYRDYLKALENEAVADGTRENNGEEDC